MSDDLDELFDATGEANDFDPHFEASISHRVEMRDEIIEALTAQNRRLREALTEIEESASPDHWSPQYQHCVDTARAALKGEPFNKRVKWGGYARPNNRHPIGDKERETGAEYIRADLAIPTDDAIRKAAFGIAILMEVHADIGTTTKAKADDIERGIRDLIYKPGKETSHE